MSITNEIELLKEQREKTSTTLLLADLEMASIFRELALAADQVEVKQQRLAEARSAVESVASRLHLVRLTKGQRNQVTDRLQLLKLQIAETAYSLTAAA
jgi:hypothetical protein